MNFDGTSADSGQVVPLRACSVCLRVLRGGQWLEAEAMIREHRSVEHPAPPRLGPALCTACAEAFRLRRVEASEPLAA